MLLLDAKGNLTVQGELDDLADYESTKPPEEAEESEKDKPPGGDEPRRRR